MSLVPEQLDRIAEELRARVQAALRRIRHGEPLNYEFGVRGGIAQVRGGEINLGSEFPWLFDDDEPDRPELELVRHESGRLLGLRDWADEGWQWWRSWVHAEVRRGRVPLDEKGRRIVVRKPDYNEPESPPPGHQEWPTPEYQSAVLVMTNEEDERDFVEAVGWLLRACALDRLIRHPNRHRIDDEQWEATIEYAVDIRLIGLDAITYAHGAQYALEGRGRIGVSKIRHADIFYDRFNDWRSQDIELGHDEADQLPEHYDEPAPPTVSYPDLENVNWKATKQCIIKLSEGSWLEPDEVNAVLEQVAFTADGVVERPAAVWRVARALQRVTPEKDWHAALANEATELVKSWVAECLRS
jgi:hypothetical protein